MAPVEKRIDEEDGQAYTWEELNIYYAGKYKKKEIAAYWESCKPAKAAKAKGKAKAEPKAKAKAEPKSKAKAKAKEKAKAGSTLPKKGVKLYYWPARGRGEQVRLALAVTGVDFEDISFDLAEEGAKETFFAQCRKLGGNSTNNTPMLEVKGKFYTQSTAIVKFVCDCGGLRPDSPALNYHIDNIIAHVEDLRPLCYKPLPLFGAGLKEAQDFMAAFPPHVANLERLLGERKYFVGSKLTAADVCVFDVLDTMVEKLVPGTLEKFYPKLAAFVQRMTKLPGIVKLHDSEQHKKLFSFDALVLEAACPIVDAAAAWYNEVNQDLMKAMNDGQMTPDQALAGANALVDAFSKACEQAGENDFKEKFDANCSSFGPSEANYKSSEALYKAINGHCTSEAQCNDIKDKFKASCNEAGDSDFKAIFSAKVGNI